MSCEHTIGGVSSRLLSDGLYHHRLFELHIQKTVPFYPFTTSPLYPRTSLSFPNHFALSHGLTTATTFAFTNPNGNGPNSLESRLHSRLSPAIQQCPSGTWINLSLTFAQSPSSPSFSKSSSPLGGLITLTKSPGMPMTRLQPR